ncbi:hypothetical protein HNQ77_001994 [Silvibacterium bohemicum]|uniref:Uncharacterized protein n=1 Tax=Silvibacterium bohemicum TaxID=1577686 RepID=A0A841JRM0_9BACT|nr:hypothetical protein [Silvibacterium bohemicum]MBB6144042.1 hypothetical protein [Silvibacterium bohemicum]
MTNPSQSKVRRRCRALRPSGYQCEAPALRGGDHCFAHDRDRRRRTAPAALEIPLLDSHAAIQTAATDIARAVAAGTLDLNAARILNATLRVAAQTLPRASSRTRSKEDSAAQPASEPVSEIVLSPEGEEMAPETPYQEQEVKQERTWSFAEYLYRTLHPDSPDAALPEAGYESPDENSAGREGSIPAGKFSSGSETPVIEGALSLSTVQKVGRDRSREENQAGRAETNDSRETIPKTLSPPIPGILAELIGETIGPRNGSALRRNCREPSECALRTTEMGI